MKRSHRLVASAALALLASTLSPAAAAAPTQWKTAAVDPTQAPVPQDGKLAVQLRETLARIKLPPGFVIELFALVPGARHLAVAPNAGLLFVGTRDKTVWAVRWRDASNAAVEVRPFAPAARFQMPNGVCWDRDGALIVVEHNRVLRFPAAEAWREGADLSVIDTVPQGRLIPPEEESRGHSARTCRVGPDGRLYITLGQPYNVQPRDKLALYERVGMGGIVRMNALDGSQREVYATGIRNSVGLEFNPKDGTLWFTDNQTDGMGDLIPDGEINRATRAGQFFGYPWKQGRTRITEHGYDKDPLPPNITDPQVSMDAHAADLGLAFYTGSSFPTRYRGGLFSAQHGSWNRSTPIGARIMFTSMKADGTAGAAAVLAEGWLDAASGRYLGRPVDVATLKDGSMLISDDHAGALYRVRYRGDGK